MYIDYILISVIVMLWFIPVTENEKIIRDKKYNIIYHNGDTINVNCETSFILGDCLKCNEKVYCDFKELRQSSLVYNTTGRHKRNKKKI